MESYFVAQVGVEPPISLSQRVIILCYESSKWNQMETLYTHTNAHTQAHAQMHIRICYVCMLCVCYMYMLLN